MVFRIISPIFNIFYRSSSVSKTKPKGQDIGMVIERQNLPNHCQAPLSPSQPIKAQNLTSNNPSAQSTKRTSVVETISTISQLAAVASTTSTKKDSSPQETAPLSEENVVPNREEVNLVDPRQHEDHYNIPTTPEKVEGVEPLHQASQAMQGQNTQSQPPGAEAILRAHAAVRPVLQELCQTENTFYNSVSTLVALFEDPDFCHILEADYTSNQRGNSNALTRAEVLRFITPFKDALPHMKLFLEETKNIQGLLDRGQNQEALEQYRHLMKHVYPSYVSVMKNTVIAYDNYIYSGAVGKLKSAVERFYKTYPDSYKKHKPNHSNTIQIDALAITTTQRVPRHESIAHELCKRSAGALNLEGLVELVKPQTKSMNEHRRSYETKTKAEKKLSVLLSQFPHVLQAAGWTSEQLKAFDALHTCYAETTHRLYLLEEGMKKNSYDALYRKTFLVELGQALNKLSQVRKDYFTRYPSENSQGRLVGLAHEAHYLPEAEQHQVRAIIDSFYIKTDYILELSKNYLRKVS